MDKDISTEQKTWQVYNFGKRNVFRLDLNESREGFCWRGRGRSFHVDGPKTEKAREPTVESLVRGICCLPAHTCVAHGLLLKTQ